MEYFKKRYGSQRYISPLTLSVVKEVIPTYALFEEDLPIVYTSLNKELDQAGEKQVSMLEVIGILAEHASRGHLCLKLSKFDEIGKLLCLEHNALT